MVALAMIPALQFDYWQWLSLQLATPVVLWGGWPFHRVAWQNLRHGAATMDTLISLGTLAAWGWSVVALFFLGAGEPDMRMSFQLIPEQGAGTEEVYFEVAAVMTTFILAGRYFEARAKRRAGSRAARPARARRQGGLGARAGRLGAAIPIERARGRRTLRRPSRREDRHRRRGRRGSLGRRPVADDRRVGTGRGRPGNAVTGATINAGGRLVVRADRVGAETALAQIARLVTEAQAGKATSSGSPTESRRSSSRS